MTWRHLISLFLLGPALAWAAPEISKNEFDHVLIEGKTYEFTAGQSGFGGIATIQRQGQTFTVELPMFVFGASLFGLTTYEEVLTTNKYYKDHVDPKLFKAQVRSFEDHPYLKAKVLDSLTQIEARFSHPHFRLKIKPSFVADEFSYFKLPGDEYKAPDLPFPYAYYAQSEQISQIQNNRRINGKKMALFIQPFVVSTNMSPVGFEIFSPFHPSLIAHEVGHILGIGTEGYTLKEYPLLGLMTAETQLEVISAENKSLTQSQLQDVDLFSILSGILSTLSESKDISPNTLEALQAKSIEALYKEPHLTPDGRGWYNMSGRERKSAIEALLKSSSSGAH